MKNPKFLQIEFSPQNAKFLNLQYIPDIANLLYANRGELFDRFFGINEENKIEKTIELVNSFAPAFWAIVDPKTNELAGVVYLYDWIGDPEFCYSVKVSTCFKRKFWGKFAHRAGKLFIRYVCAKYRPLLLCAEVYEMNSLPKRLLSRLGFKQTYEKPMATMVNGISVSVFGYQFWNNRNLMQSEERMITGVCCPY